MVKNSLYIIIKDNVKGCLYTYFFLKLYCTFFIICTIFDKKLNKTSCIVLLFPTYVQDY